MGTNITYKLVAIFIKGASSPVYNLCMMIDIDSQMKLCLDPIMTGSHANTVVTSELVSCSDIIVMICYYLQLPSSFYHLGQSQHTPEIFQCMHCQLE